MTGHATRRGTAHCRGAALLTVLFILVLLSTLVVYMVEDEHLAIRRVSNQRDAEQGYQLVIGAEQWAARVLARDAGDSEVDHLNEPWNRLLPEVNVEQGSLSAQVVDLQGRFNLNNLAAGKDDVWYPAFRRLLQLLEIDEGLADAVVDWIDENQDVNGNDGAEDAEYLALDPPYRAANRLLTDVGELNWIKGFDEKAVAALRPYVTVLPATGLPININTAPAALLRILGKELLAETDAQAIIDGRGESGYPSIAEFLAVPALAGNGDVAQALVSVASGYFEVQSRAEFGRFATVGYSVLQRNRETRQVVVLQRRRGVS